MSPYLILVIILAYMALLFVIGHISGRNANNEGFFIGNRKTSWHMATLAMIGAAMSGVTFISVPGAVAADSFSYMQMVVGFTIGQFVVAFILIPVFYKSKVTSLYEYLDNRFDQITHRTGAWCFLVAKIIGAALKIYIVCAVMQTIVFDYFNLPFTLNVAIVIGLIWLYTHSGGVRSLIVTDTLQSVCLVTSVLLCIWFICRQMGLDYAGCINLVKESGESQMWFFDNPSSPRYFWKMVAGGALSLIAMTGLDQDMMQRNMSCRTMRESQINIVLTAICQIFVILLLLVLGLVIYRYIDYAGLEMPSRGDDAFALVAIQGGVSIVVAIAFIIGMISSTYSAAGSALTSLTTSYTIDVLRASEMDEQSLTKLRKKVHIVMALILAVAIIVLNLISSDSVINLLFKVASYTYGPILGLFVFGLSCRRRLRSKFLPVIVILSPIASFAMQHATKAIFEYHIGFELLGYNALFTIFGLWLISYKNEKEIK